ncbi:GGDEF domain-containing protein [Deinococcus aerophilus]|uniref:GGDEF domain-containing protein n=1 Tax=Deinococcus aerophilus TaxID=522488 RepID=A0ABQ2GZD6_9DEIO|nr:GGDEF domain-containing protein [Deinococcus aerophilus]GGM19803.1 hypothetical protein GCM10010841_29750 [Deinococcus aerophilus]
MTDNEAMTPQGSASPVSTGATQGAGRSALREELRVLKLQAADAGSGAAAQALAHRDAAYVAFDLKDLAAAMEHALGCVQCARASGDGRLQVKAHVTLALAMLESYDDAGAQREFLLARTLAEELGDQRGVALAAVNSSHFELERRNYRQAARLLLELLTSPWMPGLLEPDAHQLWEIFHVNFVVAVSEALMAGDGDPHLRETSERQLAVSRALVAALLDRGDELSVQDASAVLDALTRHALWAGTLPEARALADEHVRVTRDADLPLLYGRALLDRSRVFSRSGDLEGAIRDAELGVRYFGEAASELWEARSREVLANAYARAGRYREAFETQQAVTRGVENLYRDYHQQRALVSQIEHQVRETEVRALALAEAALRDPLTGAPNRTQAMQVLGELYGRAQQGHPSAIALLDLDLFKRVNDTFGHLVGDAVLIEATRLLSAELREQDLLARLGGEEFIVILTDVTLQEAAAVCTRLRDTLYHAAWDALTPGLALSGSFGVATLDGAQDITSTLKAADQALYAAKAAGRNTVRVAASGGEPELQPG